MTWLLPMIKEATINDVPQILSVLRDSILSCEKDHENNKKIIENWLANKTEDNLILWINAGIAFVYKDKNNVFGFILGSYNGEILLNYVSPDRQGAGIGRDLLNKIKDVYKNNGIEKITLDSTITAKNFYIKNNFKVIDDIYENDRLTGIRMVYPSGTT